MLKTNARLTCSGVILRICHSATYFGGIRFIVQWVYALKRYVQISGVTGTLRAGRTSNEIGFSSLDWDTVHTQLEKRQLAASRPM